MLKAVLWKEAERQLSGVGDASLGEWREVGKSAVHLRRRLSAREETATGPAVDIRRSDEARFRASRLGLLLSLAPREMLLTEVVGQFAELNHRPRPDPYPDEVDELFCDEDQTLCTEDRPCLCCWAGRQD